MDAQVMAAMARWPGVPDVYGWLSLSDQGRWRIHPGGRGWRQAVAPLAGLAAADLAGEAITSIPFTEFINRNYTVDAAGCWYFQNGPQRVYVRLDAAPYLLHLDMEAGGRPLLRTHTGLAAGQVLAWWRDDQGRMFATTEAGPGLVEGRDLPALLDALHTPDGPLVDILMAQSDDSSGANLSVLPWPRPGTGATSPLRLISASDLPRTLGFVACPQAKAGPESSPPSDVKR